jgi:adenosylcobinamide-phosphate synthase
MMLTPSVFIAGFILDQVMGDPPRWPHPVIFMGKFIAWFEKQTNRGNALPRRLNGAILTLLLVGGTYALTSLLIWKVKELSLWSGLLLEVGFVATTLAGKSLLEAGSIVLTPLREGDLDAARKALSWFVSRDTSELSESELARGSVETLAENFVDGILSPLFYLALGGVPLAMAFKAVSTLDSMIGYRNERYEDFGWFAARTDDWANYVPARLSVGILLLSGWRWKMPVGHSIRTWRRDAKSHPSPNGGNPESVVAGLLGIQLGGRNIYHGKVHHRAKMGDPLHELSWKDIQSCQRLVRTATWLAFGLLLGVLVIIQ